MAFYYISTPVYLLYDDIDENKNRFEVNRNKTRFQLPMWPRNRLKMGVGFDTNYVLFLNLFALTELNNIL